MARVQAFLRDTSGDGETGNVRRHVAESLDRAAARLSACPGMICGAGVSPAQAAGTAAPQYRGVDLGQALSADAATERPELDYWAMIQDDWRREDRLVDTPEAYAKATADHLAKAARLLTDLRNDGPDDLLAAEAGQLDGLAKAVQAASSPDDCRGVYLRVRWLKRRIALANPLMQFGKLLFAKRVPTSYSHLVMQYYGWRARPGGGLFVLDAARPIAGLPRHPRRPAGRRQRAGAAAVVRRPADRLLLRRRRREEVRSRRGLERPRRGLLPRLRGERRRHGPAAAHLGPVRRPDADLPARRRDRLLLDAAPRLRPMLRRAVQPAVARLHAAPHGRRRREPPHACRSTTRTSGFRRCCPAGIFSTPAGTTSTATR